MRSTKTRTIEVDVIRGRATLPPFLGLFQRHFEKACPTVNEIEATVNAPVDMMTMIVPAAMTDPIESIEVIYQRSRT